MTDSRYINLFVGNSLITPLCNMTSDRRYLYTFSVNITIKELYRSGLLHLQNKFCPMDICLRSIDDIKQPARIHKKRRIQKKWISRYGFRTKNLVRIFLDQCSISIDFKALQSSNIYENADMIITTYNKPKIICSFGPTAKSEYISIIGSNLKLD